MPINDPSPTRKSKIEFVFFDAGGGHRSAATALQMAVNSQGLPWEVNLFNLQEALDHLDLMRQISGVRIQDTYNWMLKSGLTLGSKQLMRLLQFTISVYHRPTVRILTKRWRESSPDMVVSFVPHFNKALCESYARAFPGRPYVTILTDLANYPPRFWLEKQSQDFICGTNRAVQQVLDLGHSPDRVFRVSGMILHPRFYEPITVDRIAERRALKLSPDLPTGLVMFGGQGSKVIEQIVDRLDSSDLNLQLILICGKNEALAERLRSRKTRIPVFVEGFTTRIPYYMYLSDFFVGKPGPGSISEAIQMRLPVIVERNAWTLPQERYNAQWIRENEVGVVVRNFLQIVPAVRSLLEGDQLPQFRKNAEALRNNAVFEIPAILLKILTRDTSPS
ncbi:MAG TPA: glycosyltransferase [Candidatus Acidoferrales bacterium]|nr:glycosyltransferase [Candidatus Acidoferrales bacterium]